MNYEFEADATKPISVDGIISFTARKRIIIYGFGRSGANTLSYLTHIGLQCSYIVDVNYESLIEKYGSDLFEIKSPYDLLYEDKEQIAILLCIKKSTQAKALLDSMGFVENKHYLCFAARRSKRMTHLNPYLGWCRGDNSIVSYTKGFDSSNTKTIVALGGSTTDDEMDGLFSWPKLLQDILDEKLQYSRYCIKNAAGASYTTSQEFFQLVCHVIDQGGSTPYAVISYTGVNDALAFSKYEYVSFSAQETMSAIASEDLAMYYGYPLSDPVDLWLKNVRMMHAICAEFHTVYLCFLQPCLFISGGINALDTEIFINGPYKDSTNQTDVFYSSLKKKIASFDYIIDLSDIFDNHTDLYLDWCHLTQEGNKILANEIYRHLKEREVV